MFHTVIPKYSSFKFAKQTCQSTKHLPHFLKLNNNPLNIKKSIHKLTNFDTEKGQNTGTSTDATFPETETAQ